MSKILAIALIFPLILSACVVVPPCNCPSEWRVVPELKNEVFEYWYDGVYPETGWEIPLVADPATQKKSIYYEIETATSTPILRLHYSYKGSHVIETYRIVDLG